MNKIAIALQCAEPKNALVLQKRVLKHVIQKILSARTNKLKDHAYNTQLARKNKGKTAQDGFQVTLIEPRKYDIYFIYGLADFSCSRVSTATGGIG